MAHYIDQTMIAARLSSDVVRRIYDDNNDGTSDTSPLTQLETDAEAKFEGYCRGTYDLPALRLAHPNEARRLCLDIVVAMAAKRFPKAMNREWLPLEQSVNAELLALRQGKTRFDVVGSPEPAANHGGDVVSGVPGVADDEIPENIFQGEW